MVAWTEEEIKILQENYTKKTLSELSVMLNRSRESVNGKLRLMGVPRREKRHWTDEETEFLRENYEKLGLDKLSEIFGRNKKNISVKAVEMGITSSSKWTNEEDEYLIKHYKKIAAEEIGKHLNRSVDGVIKRAKKLGLSKELKLWTDEEEKYIKAKWGKVTIAYMAKKLNRTETAIMVKADTLGLREQIVANGEYFTPLYMAEMLGMNQRYIYRLISTGMLEHRKFKVGTIKKYQITIEQIIDFLRKYPDKWNSKIADIGLIKSYLTGSDSEEKEANSLPDWLVEKIEYDRKHPVRRRRVNSIPWTIKEERKAIELKLEGRTLKDMAKVLKRTETSVRTKLDRLKIENKVV